MNTEYYKAETEDDGSISLTWKPCKVMGYHVDDDGSPKYIVEVCDRGECWLEVASHIRKRPKAPAFPY